MLSFLTKTKQDQALPRHFIWGNLAPQHSILVMISSNSNFFWGHPVFDRSYHFISITRYEPIERVSDDEEADVVLLGQGELLPTPDNHNYNINNSNNHHHGFLQLPSLPLLSLF